MSKKGIIGLIAALICLGVLGGFGYPAALRYNAERYTKLTQACEKALDKGDARGAAKLAISAMQGSDWPLLGFDSQRAQGLLREALLVKQAPFKAISQKQLPKYKRGHVNPVNVVVSPDGSKAMVFSNEQPDQEVVYIYELPSGRIIRQFFARGINASATQDNVVEFSSDLNTALIQRLGKFILIDTVSGKSILEDIKLPSGVYDIRISNDRRFFAVGSLADDHTGVFQIRDLKLNAPVFEYRQGASDDSREFEISPDNTIVVTTQDIFVRKFIDIKTGKVMLTQDPDGAMLVVFSSDGKFFVTSKINGETADGLSWKHSIQVWNAPTYKPLGPPLEISTVRSATTLFKGKVMALQTDNGIRFLDMATHRLIADEGENVGGYESSPGWHDGFAYAVDPNHVLHAYALNPVLGFDGAALIAEAQKRWGA